ncbi:MAG TPA: GAF domain-containing protein [Burkholderiales bacterium]|jgi:hypothetical protein|nr:GAF domain-containing protein [Burkholderiales bacterium]
MASVYVEVLRRAAEIVGGDAALRERLHASARELDEWMRGRQQPPTYVFLMCVDLVSAGSVGAGRARDSLERAVDLRGRLLEQGLVAARRRSLSVDDFCDAEFASSEAQGIVDAALSALVGATGAQRANLQLVSEEGLRLVAHLGFRQPFLDFFAVVGHDVPSTCGRAAEEAQRVVVRDVASDPIFVGSESAGVMLEAGARACISTPLFDADDRLVGMLSAHYEEPHAPGDEELAAIDRVAARTAHWLGAGRA